MRGFLIGLFVLVLLIAGAGYWIYSSLDSLVEAGIEKVGSALTETDVNVASADISLPDKTASITGFTIANPAGFSKNPAFALDNINLSLDTDRSTRHVITIRELRISNPVVNYEIAGKKNNIDIIAKAVERNTQDKGGAQAKDDDESLRFVIDRFIITKGEVKVYAKGDKVASSDLPAVSLNNIGAGKGGVTGAELGQIIVGEMSRGVKKSIASGALNKFLGAANDNMKNLKNKFFKH